MSEGIRHDDRYVTPEVCARLHGESDKRIVELMSMVSEMNARLYKDNGKLSIQTRLDRGDRILGVLCWAASIAGSALILALLTLGWKTLVKVWLVNV